MPCGWWVTDPPPRAGARLHRPRRRAGRSGDRVLLNASALLRGLGTGGLAFVVARARPAPADPPADPKRPHRQGALHTAAADVHGGRRAGQPAPRRDLGRTPATCRACRWSWPTCTPPCRRPRRAAGRTPRRPGRLPHDRRRRPADRALPCRRRPARGRLAAQHGDGGAGLRRRARGRHDLHSGLLAAKHVLGADVAVVIQGPGNVGTGTSWGYTGWRQAQALNAVFILHRPRGRRAARVGRRRPRAAPRDLHHSRTAYGRVALVPADLCPTHPDGRVRRAGAAPGPRAGGRRPAGDSRPGRARTVSTRRCAAAPVRPVDHGPRPGRGPRAFLYSAAAGRYAARLLDGAARRAGPRSAHVHEVDHEDQRLTRLDRAARATVAVREVRRGS